MCGTSGDFCPFSVVFPSERAAEGAAPGRAADLGRGDGLAAQDVPEHGRLRGGAGGRPHGRQHPGGRSGMGWGQPGMGLDPGILGRVVKNGICVWVVKGRGGGCIPGSVQGWSYLG